MWGTFMLCFASIQSERISFIVDCMGLLYRRCQCKDKEKGNERPEGKALVGLRIIFLVAISA